MGTITHGWPSHLPIIHYIHYFTTNTAFCQTHIRTWSWILKYIFLTSCMLLSICYWFYSRATQWGHEVFFPPSATPQLSPKLCPYQVSDQMEQSVVSAMFCGWLVLGAGEGSWWWSDGLGTHCAHNSAQPGMAGMTAGIVLELSTGLHNTRRKPLLLGHSVIIKWKR